MTHPSTQTDHAGWKKAANVYRQAIRNKSKADDVCRAADKSILTSGRSAEALEASRLAEEAWNAAFEIIDAAFKEAADFPVSDVATLVAKFDLLTANLDEDRDWEREVLVTALGADLRRISGKEA